MTDKRYGKYEDNVQTWEYHLADGWRVTAGKTDRDNDILSIKIARPNDWWFHASAVSGSHVLLRNDEPVIPSKEIIKAAAAVAAYHSKMRTGGNVAVTYTQAKYISKPRGAKPGLVQLKRQVTINVRPALPASLNPESSPV